MSNTFIASASKYYITFTLHVHSGFAALGGGGGGGGGEGVNACFAMFTVDFTPHLCFKFTPI